MKTFKDLGYTNNTKCEELIILRNGDTTLEINLEKETVKKYYKSKYTDGLSTPMDLTFEEIGLLANVFLKA